MGAYPNEPGWRAGANEETSRAAAQMVAPAAGKALDRIADALAAGPMTPEELHALFAAAGAPMLLTSIRARTTQGFKQGLFCPSGTYGIGESGRAKVIRWRRTTNEERALHNAQMAASAEKSGRPE